ncbi:MAG: type I DNA topoisomerase [Candidatus Binatia bacterium]
MNRRLVIVESPTKARTLRRFLGDGYIVESSVGHVRDLPGNASEVPAKYKKEKWARLGVDVENDFAPLYVVSPEKKKVISDLKKKLQQADELLLATDEDREGEAISWHLVQLLKPKIPTRRMVFHEITREAVLQAIEETREVDENLVQAQEARRIIDRLYGYEVSPILWRKIKPRLSAGRVQSVAIRMLVDREKARMRFRAARYWDLSATFETSEGKRFPARLYSLGGKRLAGGKDFDPDSGELKRDDVVLLEADRAEELRTKFAAADFRVDSTEEKPFSRSPSPPFTTSTLQQEGGRKLGFDSRRTMRAAQRLYEMGFITYMRTDSVALAPEALRATRDAVERMYGRDYLPPKPRGFRNKVKNAQEAHEAIRPAGEAFSPPAEIAGRVSSDELKVYDLIWKRTMACQMLDARGRRMQLRVAAWLEDHDALFQANGNVIDFPGYLRAYVEGSDDPEAALADREVLLPRVAAGDPVGLVYMESDEHVTQPPPRLTEASLVKLMEESGIGRPSTYASIIDTIQRREYTFKKGSALVPTFTAFAVVHLMVEHFGHLIDQSFTAAMEDRLDAISRGEHEAAPYLREFYYGDGEPGLRPLLDKKAEDIDPRTVCSIPMGTDESGRAIVVRVGRYGPYLQRGEETATIPDTSCPDELTVEVMTEFIEEGAKGPEVLGQHPESGLPVYLKQGRFGPYVQLGDPSDSDKQKPPMASLLRGMDPASVTLEVALGLLSLPRSVGKDEQGVEILAFNGRYGPYIKRGDESRSLEDGDDPLSIDLKRALELLAQEKVHSRGRRAEPIRVFEKVEALGGADVRVLNGRYGPYATDGETNASLPRDMENPASISESDAVQLILDRRARGSVKKKASKQKATKKKATKKKASKKKATRKKTAKKAAKKRGPVKKASGGTGGERASTVASDAGTEGGVTAHPSED